MVASSGRRRHFSPVTTPRGVTIPRAVTHRSIDGSLPLPDTNQTAPPRCVASPRFPRVLTAMLRPSLPALKDRQQSPGERRFPPVEPQTARTEHYSCPFREQHWRYVSGRFRSSSTQTSLTGRSLAACADQIAEFQAVNEAKLRKFVNSWKLRKVLGVFQCWQALCGFDESARASELIEEATPQGSAVLQRIGSIFGTMSVDMCQMVKVAFHLWEGES